MRIPNLYLKWHAFRELANLVDTDKDVGVHLFRHEDGAEPFSKLIRGDLGCADDIAESLTAYMNNRIALRHTRAGAQGRGTPAVDALVAADLQLPTLTFVAKLLRLLPSVTRDRLDRAHAALLSDMQVLAPKSERPKLLVERYAMSRQFDAMKPSGGAGPVVFKAGQHQGQLAVIGVPRSPLAAYTMVTRDPAPAGKRIWELAWGEAVLWLPSPSVPPLSEGRLLLMPEARPVLPTPGRFTVTTSLVWREDALKALEPRRGDRGPDALDESETALYLTRLRRIIDDKRGRWTDAATVLSAEYEVEV